MALGANYMVETRTHRRISRSRKKRRIPLVKLRASEVVRTVVDHPRRLGELVNLLNDTDRAIRGRAANTLARLSESHPGRLLRILDRLSVALADESAYVRWYLVYAFGRVASKFPARAQRFLTDLIARLDDDNRVVRVLTIQALGRVAASKPQMIQELFQSTNHAVPPAVTQVLRSSGLKSEKA